VEEQSNYRLDSWMVVVKVVVVKEGLSHLFH
jgi:hypothetical protein